MKIVDIEDVPLLRGLEHRGGTFHSRTLVEGRPRTSDNFKFSLSRLGTDYSGPRHRHNFDQFRYMIEGESDYGDGSLRPGMLGYYPEGVPYGPQINRTEIYGAVLQFGGASGSGYLLPREVKAGMEELKAYGEFRDGVFHRHDGAPGKRNMDAYQAIWEHVHRRAMVYPKARYDAPVFMDAANYQWVPVKGAAGVREKLFGTWTERRTEAGLIKLDAGASYQMRGRGLYLLLSGGGECENKMLKQYSTLFLDYCEHAMLRASEESEILHYGLPDFSDASILSATVNEMQAAE
jgi:hypothetical protein